MYYLPKLEFYTVPPLFFILIESTSNFLEHMQTLATFSKHDLERLFITYKRNFSNYSKIKDKVIGKNAEKIYKRNRKTSIFFFVAVTFIIGVSSIFSLVTNHTDSFIALWMIWGIVFVFFSAWSVFFYRTSYSIIQKNEDFFNRFETIAKDNQSLEDFKTNW